MTTLPPDKQVVAETLENVVKLIMVKCVSRKGSVCRDELRTAILSALRNERERCAKVAESHKHVPICDGAGCKIVIAMTIREGK